MKKTASILSPLLFPVNYKEGAVFVLDETALPFKETYIKVKTLKQALKVLGQMKTRAFGQVLLYFYTCLLQEGEGNTAKIIKKTAQEFKKTRPTFDFFSLSKMLHSAYLKAGNLEKAVAGIISGFDQLRLRRVSQLAAALPKKARILTICNINGELLYLYQAMRRLKKQCMFYVSETRPYLQGTRLTFWELAKNNVKVKLCCDSQAASLMKEGKINCIVTGADRVNLSGDIVNKIGTYSLASLAANFSIPFYPLTQYATGFTQKSLKIEMRPQKEVFLYMRPRNFAAFYPSFDFVPQNLVSGWADISGFKINKESRKLSRAFKKNSGLICVFGPLTSKALVYLKNNVKKKEKVVIFEGRPYLSGIYNARLLRQNKIPFIYSPDNTAGFLFLRRKIKSALIGYTKKNANYYLAPSGAGYFYFLSKSHKVKVYLFPGKTIPAKDKDASTLEGKDFLFYLKRKKDFIVMPKEEKIPKEKDDEI